MKLTFAFATLFLAGCLKTRGDLRQEPGDLETSHQVPAAQRAQASVEPAVVAAAPVAAAPAPVASLRPAPPQTPGQRMDDIDEQMRVLTGRVEVVENAVGQASVADDQRKADVAKDKAALEQRLAAYEESIKTLNAVVAQMSADVTALKAAPPPPPPLPPPPPPAPAKPTLEQANELFGQKKWREAAASFQKHREQNPKGKSYADATYKIGVCFQELGLKDEARAFYDEVVAKYPGSKDAKKAQFRAKSLK